MRRLALVLAVLAAACGDENRICANPPCLVPGQPSPVCTAYVKCYEKTQGLAGTLDSTYGKGGMCWTSGQSFADACTNGCSSGLPGLRAAFPDAGC